MAFNVLVDRTKTLLAVVTASGTLAMRQPKVTQGFSDVTVPQNPTQGSLGPVPRVPDPVGPGEGPGANAAGLGTPL